MFSVSLPPGSLVCCVCLCVCGECDVLIRAEFLIPGDRAAHPHELNNGCPLQRSSNPQLSKDRTGQDSLPVLSNLTAWEKPDSANRCPAVCI